MKSEYSEYLLLANISALFVVIPLLIGYSKMRYFKTPEKFWLALVTVSAVIEIIARFHPKNHHSNHYIYNIYTVIEFCLISFFFIKIISQPKLVLIIKIFIILFLGVTAFDLISNGYESMGNLSTTTESILFILYSSSFFYLLMKNPIHVNVLAIPAFWLNAAVMLYFSGNLFLFIFSNYLELHSEKVLVELFTVHSILNILSYSLISIAFWKTKRQ